MPADTIGRIVSTRARAALGVAIPSLLVAIALALATPAEAAPVASFNFSPLQPLTSELVTFTSTSSGGTEQWDLDGDGLCDDASGVTVQRSFPTAGVYTVTLCVSDGITQATQPQKVTVFNRAPVATFTYAPLAPLSGDRVLLTSTSVDPDGPITGQAWDLDNDGGFDDGTGETASILFAKAGTYVVRLLVVDRDGAASVGEGTIKVAARPLELLASFPVVRLAGKITRRGTKIRKLTVNAPDGARVEVGCRGRGCPFRRLTKGAARTSKLVTIRRLRGRLLRPQAVIQIWVTRPDALGKYTRFRIRRGRPPSRADRCAVTGVRRPVRCPTGSSA
jgi:hypothetical protein